MPILNIEIVGDDLKGQENLSQKLADAAAKVLETKPGNTWVKLHFLGQTNYAENGETPQNLKPVFVSVLLGHCPEEMEMSRVAQELATAFGNALNRPSENIHILFEPSAIGRIAFGGKLRTE